MAALYQSLAVGGLVATSAAGVAYGWLASRPRRGMARRIEQLTAERDHLALCARIAHDAWSAWEKRAVSAEEELASALGKLAKARHAHHVNADLRTQIEALETALDRSQRTVKLARTRNPATGRFAKETEA